MFASSCSLLIRGNIAAVRQEIHLSLCPNFPSHLCLSFTQLNKEALWVGAVAYYVLYFFLKPCLLAMAELFGRSRNWLLFRCPYCKSREVILQGYQGYHSDEHYAYYLCNHCRETSVLVNDRLIKSRRG